MQRHAFTLIELLVVVAVIAVLAALLIPGINIVRDNANLANCASNQRQIVLAMVAYKADDGSWPCRPSTWGGQFDNTNFATSDAFAGYNPYYTSATFEWVVNKMDGQLPPRSVVCPARKNNIPPVANPNFKSFGGATAWQYKYDLNPSNPLEVQDPNGPAWKAFANRFADEKNLPSVMAYAYDWAVPRKAAPNRAILADRPLDTGDNAPRSTHGRRGGNKYRVNVAFVDGHVEAVLARVDSSGNTTGWTHNQNLDKSVAGKWESDLNTDEDPKVGGDNIYSNVNDGGYSLRPGRGSTTRAWVK